MRLPEEWLEIRLSPLISALETGGRPSGGVGEIESGVPSISGEHFGWDGRFEFSSLKYIPNEYYETLQTGRVKVGDVLVVKDGATTAKCAYVDDDFPYEEAAINEHVFLLRAAPHLLNSRFLFELLRSEYGKVQILKSYRGAAIGGIPRGFTDHVKLLLPTLPEQQCIVDSLRQAEEIEKVQTSRRQQLDLMINAALDRLVLSVDESQWLPLGSLVETRYGTSVSADATQASGTPVLRIPNVMGGEVDTTDMKYVELPQAELQRLRLADSDVLIVRSNGNPDYVGRSAPITEDLASSLVVYASYLIRLRTDTQRLLPEYLSAFLNSAFGRAAMRNAIRTTAGQSNLSGENLSKVRMPLPSLVEQKWFKDFWLEVRQLRRLLAMSEHTAAELRRALTVDALSGDLTDGWRQKHAEEVASAAEVRDALLRERGAKLNKPAEPAPILVRAPDSERPTRHWLQGELSAFQRQVLAAFARYCEQTAQPLLAEDPDLFAQFCDDTEVQQALQPFGANLNNRIRRTLSQLAALGLIAKVTLPKYDADSGEREFLKAFRPLRLEEFTRADDILALRKALSVGENSYRFTVVADYETSERAGAGGMFQVADLLDDSDNSRTDLVDQGKHYATLDELKADLAQRLGVPPNQIELEP